MEWLYGRNVVKLALGAGSRRRAFRLAATPPALAALGGVPPGLPVDTRSARELDELCGSREHQGVALQVERFRYADPQDLLRGQVVVVLDEVSDPHNLGAVARSALAAGASGLVVPRHRAAAVTPAAVKASAGVIELLPVAQVTNTVAFLKEAKDAGFWVYGAEGRSRTRYTDLDLTGRLVLVVGAEGHGLRPLVARTCDALASIPIDGRVESLNVSVAAALFLFEARRQSGTSPAPARPRASARCPGEASPAPRGPHAGPLPGQGPEAPDAGGSARGGAGRPAGPKGRRPRGKRPKPRGGPGTRQGRVS